MLVREDREKTYPTSVWGRRDHVNPITIFRLVAWGQRCLPWMGALAPIFSVFSYIFQ